MARLSYQVLTRDLYADASSTSQGDGVWFQVWPKGAPLRMLEISKIVLTAPKLSLAVRFGEAGNAYPIVAGKLWRTFPGGDPYDDGVWYIVQAQPGASVPNPGDVLVLTVFQ